MHVAMIFTSLFPLLFFLENVHDVSAKKRRIVGGYLVPIEKFPYLVSIQILRKHICGGAILNEKYIITAAHCVEKRTPTFIKAGVHDIKQEGIVRKIKKARMHPSYDKYTLDFDVAVIELSDRLKFIRGKIMPIALPKSSSRVPLTSATVMGWGVTQNYAEDSTLLRAVDLEIYSKATCAKYPVLDMKPSMICAGHISGRKDSCQGDSGGPLVVDDVLYGIVSHGVECASNVPGVYTNVPYVVKWIANQAKLS